MNYIKFKSYSGDWYNVPKETANDDVKAYLTAIMEGNEHKMLWYESGMTGWVHLGDNNEKD